MLCAYTRSRHQVSVYRTIGPLVLKDVTVMDSLEIIAACDLKIDE